MDGPPALTLGLEMQGFELMSNKPIKRSNSIVTKKMFYKILIHTLIMCLLLILQAKYNFIGCYDYQMKTVLFNLFIIFQLFNAFNCRELGAKSVFSEFKKNKLMVIVFSITFVLQIIFSELGSSFFGTTNLSIIIWVRIILVAMIIVFLSEIYKYFYRLFIKRQKNYKNFRKSFN